MALQERTSQEQLTPEARRGMLRAFADRMLLKVTAMDDPEDMPGIERAVRVAAVIERVYSRSDRAEAHAPDPRKAEAERAHATTEAIKARVSLANSLKWGEDRRKDLGQWWEAADTSAQTQALAQPPASGQNQTSRPDTAQVQAPLVQPTTPAKTPAVKQSAAVPSSLPDLPRAPAKVDYVDYSDAILKARADLGLMDEQDHPATGGCDPPP